VVMWSGRYASLLGTDAAKATRLGERLGARYGNQNHVLWIVAGEYDEYGYYPIYDAMAQGLRSGSGGAQLLTIHPAHPTATSSSLDFHSAGWLDFNMIQWRDPSAYSYVAHDYGLQPTKPTVLAETYYEVLDPTGVTEATVRRQAYSTAFAGAFGHAYG